MNKIEKKRREIEKKKLNFKEWSEYLYYSGMLEGFDSCLNLSKEIEK